MPNVPNNIPPPSGPMLFEGQVGDAQDFYNRLIAQLPNWFGTSHPILDIVLQAYIVTGVFNYSQLQYDNLQMRLQTCTEDNLDLFAEDYFGNSFPRREGENDDSYRARISANLLQEKATRPAMSNALYRLTGFYPIIFEPFNYLDCGGYNVANYPSTIGYSTHGSYGSSSYAYQCFIDVFVDVYEYMGNYSGYNDTYFGYNATGGLASGWYGGDSLIKRVITNQDIYQTINLTKCFGTICWVSIRRKNVTTSFYYAQTNFTGTQSMPGSDVDTLVQFDNVIADGNSIWNPITFSFVPTIAGKYSFSSILHIQSGFSGDELHRFSVYKNGAPVFLLAQTLTLATESFTTLNGGDVIVTANGSTDYFQIYYSHQNAANSTIGNNGTFGPHSNLFQIRYLGT